MKKIEGFGKVLSKEAQKAIKGGRLEIIFEAHCRNGRDLEVSCPSGSHVILNDIDGSLKCCSATVDCCRGQRCDGTSFAVGSAC